MDSEVPEDEKALRPRSAAFTFRNRRCALPHDRARHRANGSLHDYFRLFGSSQQSVRGGGGIPLAAVGAAAYFTVFSLATLAAFGYRIAANF